MKKLVTLLSFLFLLGLLLIPMFQISPSETTSQDTEGAIQTAAGELGYLDIWSATYEIAVEGNIAYLAAYDDGLRCIDISDPANPAEIGSYICGECYFVAIAGNVAYVVNTTHLMSIDITDPRNPSLLDTYQCPTPDYGDICISGDVLYFAAMTDGLRTIDITDPSNLVELDADNPTWNPTNVAVAGDTAVVLGVDRIALYNVTFPADISYITHITQGGHSWGEVEIAGNVAYIAHGGSGLVSVDITDPTNPSTLDSILGWFFDIEIAGDLAYCSAYSNSEVRCFDVSNPADMTLIGSTALLDLGFSVDIEGDVIYVSTEYEGLRCFRISEFIMPTTYLAQVDLPSSESSESIAIAGDILYLGTRGYDRFYSFNISNPLSPVQLDVITGFPGDVDHVVLAGDVAYLVINPAGAGNDRLVSVNITDPSDLVVLQDRLIGTEIHDIRVAGDILYMQRSGGIGGVETVNITDPSNMVTILYNTLSGGGGSYGELAGDVLWATGGAMEIKSIDISDPQNLANIAVLNTGELYASMDIAVEGNVAYVVNRSGGVVLQLVSINITDPTDPTVLGHVDLGAGYTYHIAVSGDLAVVGASTDGFYLVNVSDPANPETLGHLDSYSCGQFVIAGKYLYVADGWFELRIYQIRQDGLDDRDGDGLTYLEEVWTYGTNPNLNNQPWDSNPANQAFEKDSAAQLNWTLYDPEFTTNAGFYRVTSNGTDSRDWTAWDHGTLLSLPITTSTVGFYSYAIEYNNTAGLTGSETVIITITENNTPWATLIYPVTDPVSYAYDADANLTFVLFDEFGPGMFRITSNGTDGQAWTAWTSSNNSQEVFTIDTTLSGTWLYTIEYTDIFDNAGTSLTVTIVIQSKSGGIPGFEWVLTLMGLFAIPLYRLQQKKPKRI